MSQQELESILKIVAASGLDSSAPLEARRAAFDAFVSRFPTPSSYRVETVAAGGLPAILVTPDGSDARKTLLFFHGGDYGLGSARGFQGMASAFAQAAGCRVLIPDYRLAPEHRHPAAVEDAATAYEYLLGRSASANSIALVGDSAGGGLTCALLAALKGRGAPMPAAAALISPWLDLEGTGATMKSNAASDPLLTPEGLAEMAASYLQGGSARAPSASPLYTDPAGFPPLLIQVGTREILLDDSLRFANRAAKANVKVVLKIWPGMTHDWPVFAPVLVEGREAIAEAGVFLEAHMR
jgi:acetyl esterase/lipase